MTSLRSRLLILCIAACAGCQHSAVIDTETAPNKDAMQPSMSSPEVFDIAHDFGREVTVDGVLEGQWIYGSSRSGDTYGATYKGTGPLQIRYRSVNFPLLADDEVAKLLVDQAGNFVRLQGRIRQIQDHGRPTLPSAQQGYTGPIPGHTVYYLDVTSCESIEAVEIK